MLIRMMSIGLLVAAGTAHAQAQAQKPTDAQIAGIVVAANTVDVEAGKQAEAKTKSKDVQDFAKRMVTDHSAVNKSAAALAKKLGVTPADSDTSKALTDGGKKERAKLQKLSGAAFDKEYVDNEVAYHQTVLDALDKTLIPDAQNAELKALLEKTRPAFVAHLEHAKKVQAELAAAKPAGKKK
jgi:putative membrane protein